jgi:hypothetical protein
VVQLLAAAQGSQLADAFLTELTEQMTPVQISEAQQLAREWEVEGEVMAW